jgi:hypothetical protein
MTARESSENEARRIKNLIYQENSDGEKVKRKYLVTEVFLSYEEEMKNLVISIIDECREVILALFSQTQNNSVVFFVYVPEGRNCSYLDLTDKIMDLNIRNVTVYKPRQIIENTITMEIILEGSPYDMGEVLSRAMSQAVLALK